ncbi:hypothetical protein NBRC3257_2710 [Gluconobacter thailandicus NBRC 3257]|uniref:Uncharacterized protein n=1 Tax=Gluconobacter thailandicus NBRC 3257 TaxID=1381097 RepID=A0ABQ0IZT3_GLUTH|nr:hypothetical protein NBRC3255_1844 [Gluconobacter thailandicus NBRC 3255]GAD27711.1 hypothetical protein NBRC3257_2710 [Gluconobacter thailandicus NBRC 3257]
MAIFTDATFRFVSAPYACGRSDDYIKCTSEDACLFASVKF